MAGIKQVLAPTEDVLGIDEIKSFLRIDFTNDDQFLITQLKMVTNIIENYLNSALINRTYELALDRIPENELPIKEGVYTGAFISYPLDYISLPFSPVVSIESIKTFDDVDNETTVSSAKYILDNYRKPARVVLRNGETWPNATREVNTIIIRYIAGYGTGAQVPEAIRLAMLQLVAYTYENRGDQLSDMPAMPEAVVTLLAPYKILGLSSKLGI